VCILFLFCYVDRAYRYTCAYEYNETNFMHYLSSVYSVTIPLNVSGLLVAHHQEVTVYICNSWYVLYVLVGCRRAWLEWNFADSRLKRTTGTNCCMCTLLPPDNGARGGAVVKALCYKPEGRGIDSRWCHWNFSLTSFRPHYGPGVDSASNRNEYQEYFLGVKAAGA
jgi:hypothetical protein